MIPIFNNQPWVAEAACAQTDGDLFFPLKGESNRDAKRICAGCPCRESCFDWAMDTGQRHAILGGYTDKERRQFKRGRALRPLPEPVERSAFVNGARGARVGLRVSRCIAVLSVRRRGIVLSGWNGWRKYGTHRDRRSAS